MAHYLSGKFHFSLLEWVLTNGSSPNPAIPTSVSNSLSSNVILPFLRSSFSRIIVYKIITIIIIMHHADSMNVEHNFVDVVVREWDDTNKVTLCQRMWSYYPPTHI